MATANRREMKTLDAEAQNIDAKQREEKTRFQMFKIIEVAGESIPQSVLQLSTVMKVVDNLANTYNILMTEFWISPLTSTFSTILSSVLSLVQTGI